MELITQAFSRRKMIKQNTKIDQTNTDKILKEEVGSQVKKWLNLNLLAKSLAPSAAKWHPYLMA